MENYTTELKKLLSSSSEFSYSLIKTTDNYNVVNLNFTWWSNQKGNFVNTFRCIVPKELYPLLEKGEIQDLKIKSLHVTLEGCTTEIIQNGVGTPLIYLKGESVQSAEKDGIILLESSNEVILQENVDNLQNTWSETGRIKRSSSQVLKTATMAYLFVSMIPYALGATKEDAERAISLWVFVYPLVLSLFLRGYARYFAMIITALVVVLTYSAGLIGVLGKTCESVPMYNSTVTVNNKLLYSTAVRFSYRAFPDLCMSNVQTNNTKISVNNWRNNYSVKGCYMTDDPLFLKVGDMVANGNYIRTKNFCECSRIGRPMPDFGVEDCTGTKLFKLGRHDSGGCPLGFLVKGEVNYYYASMCLAGFNRFRVCEIDDSIGGNADISVFKTGGVNGSESYQFTTTGSVGRAMHDNFIIQYRQTVNNDLKGKMVVVDNSKLNLYIMDKLYVNTINEYNVKKIGWFRKGDKLMESSVSEQLSIELKDCDKNVIAINTIFASVSDTITSQDGHTRAYNLKAHYAINNTIMHDSSMKGPHDVPETDVMFGFFLFQENGNQRMVGIAKDGTCPGADERTYTANITSPTGVAMQSQTTTTDCKHLIRTTTGLMDLNFRFDGRDPKYNFVWGRKYNEDGSSLQLGPYNCLSFPQFTVLVWPNNQHYTYRFSDKCALEFVSKTEIVRMSEHLIIDGDDSNVELNIQIEEPILPVSVRTAKVSKFTINCVLGVCDYILKSDKFPAVVKSDGCISPSLTYTETGKMFTSIKCEGVHKFDIMADDELVATFYNQIDILPNSNVSYVNSAGEQTAATTNGLGEYFGYISSQITNSDSWWAAIWWILKEIYQYWLLILIAGVVITLLVVGAYFLLPIVSSIKILGMGSKKGTKLTEPIVVRRSRIKFE